MPPTYPSRFLPDYESPEEQPALVAARQAREAATGHRGRVRVILIDPGDPLRIS